MTEFIKEPCPKDPGVRCTWCGSQPYTSCLDPDYAVRTKRKESNEDTMPRFDEPEDDGYYTVTLEDEPTGETKDPNYKDLTSVHKISPSLIPEIAIVQLAQAFRDGALKYGAFNWRASKVRASVYVDAIERHLLLYRAGQDNASDSGLSHLAHIMSSCAILLDAVVNETLNDDRNPYGNPELLEGVLRHAQCRNSLRGEKV